MHAPLAFVPGQAISGLENRTLSNDLRRQLPASAYAFDSPMHAGINLCRSAPRTSRWHLKDDKIIAASDRTLDIFREGLDQHSAGRSDVKRSCQFEIFGFCGDYGQYFPYGQSR